jgi:hypothetical protein
MSVPHVLSIVFCVVALVWPGLSAASYLIQLRNGRQVATSQYWKEEHTITTWKVMSQISDALKHFSCEIKGL